MADEDARRQVFIKCEQLVTVTMPGGAKANIKCGPGLLRKVDNRTRQVDEQKVFMLDLDVFFDGKMPLGQVAGALNIVHDNAGSLFFRCRPAAAAGRHGAGRRLISRKTQRSPRFF